MNLSHHKLNTRRNNNKSDIVPPGLNAISAVCTASSLFLQRTLKVPVGGVQDLSRTIQTSQRLLCISCLGLAQLQGSWQKHYPLSADLRTVDLCHGKKCQQGIHNYMAVIQSKDQTKITSKQSLAAHVTKLPSVQSLLM